MEETGLPAISKDKITQLKSQYEIFRELQQKVLEKDVDYGFPHGRREGKPTLYKSGAEKLTRLFNLIPHFELLKAVEEEAYVYYMFKATLTTPSGQVVGEGFGSCNSKEKKHWDEHPLANANTILKMAKKRAHVDAVLTGLGASNVFTQDLEDFEPEHSQASAPAPTPETTQPEPSGQPQHASQSKAKPATEKQLKLIAALLRDAAEAMQKSPDEIKQGLKEFFKIEHLNELSSQQASEAIDMLKNIIAAQGMGEQENSDTPPF